MTEADRAALLEWVRLQIWTWEGSGESPNELAERLVDTIAAAVEKQA